MILDTARRTALYRFYDCVGDLLYVGIAFSVRTRFMTHAAEAPWYQDARVIRIEWYDTREEADAAERQAIVDEVPGWNTWGSWEAIQPDDVVVSCQMELTGVPEAEGFNGAGYKRVFEAIALAERRSRAIKLRESGMTYREIAEDLGLCQGTIYNYMKGARQ